MNAVSGKTVQMAIDVNSRERIFLRGIDLEKGILYFNGVPSTLRREEKFYIDGNYVLTDQFCFSLDYLNKWLNENEAFDSDNQAISIIPTYQEQ